MKTNKTTRTLSTGAMGAALASQQGMTELGIEKEISRIVENEHMQQDWLPVSCAPLIRSKKTRKVRNKNKIAKQSRKKNR